LSRFFKDYPEKKQGFFAKAIGSSKKTVESWEYGRVKSNSAAARVLTIAQTD